MVQPEATEPTATVSVIIPARDAAGTIGTTLESLVADRAVIREIVIVDDGSTDATADAATSKALKAGLPLTLVKRNVQNAGASRNIGLDKVDGKFVFFIDADDEVVPGGLGALVNCLQSNPGSCLAVGGYIRRTEGRSDRPRMPEGYQQDRLTNAHKYLKNELRSIAMGSALVRREAIKSIRFPETLQFDEDTFFWASVLSQADVSAVQKVVLVYNVVDDRYMERFTVAARSEFLKLAIELNRLKSFGLEENVLKWRKGWIARRIARAFINIGDPVSARRFLRAAIAHPELARSPTTLRYAARIRLRGLQRSLSRRIGLGEAERKAASS